MSNKLSIEQFKKSKYKIKNEKNESNNKFESNYAIDDDFWKDCLVSREKNVSKNIRERGKVNDTRSNNLIKIEINNKIDVKQKIKNDIIGRIIVSK